MSKHTSGPWVVVADETISVRDRRDGSIATMGWLTSRSAGPRRSDAEIAANARLIAAAPELLEALKNYLSGCSNEECEYCIHARAAIAKAEG